MNIRHIIYLIYPLFLSACTLLQPTSINDIISERVNARWQALIEQKWADAYLYETKGYRESHSVGQFKSKFGQAVAWQSIEILSINLDESQTNATVTVRLPYTTSVFGSEVRHSTADLSEIWLLDKDTWWHYMQ